MNNLQQIQGVTFENTNDYGRGQVMGYHSKPSPIFRNKALPVDLQGLKAEDRRVIKMEYGINGDEAVSKYTIGFEIEKTRLYRGAVQEYPLFCGFERDSSCGYEAVTHVLPLLPKSMWRTKVFNMFKEAEHIIDDRYSPSDYSCGGHITIAVDGMTGDELMAKIRPYASILLSVFRKRLTNRYCNGNPQMLPSGAEGINTRTGKYSIAKNTGFGIEFRIPSRVQSVKQMIRRYELMYEMVDACVNDVPYASFLRKVKPILISMYEGDTAKVDRLIELAKHFRKFILTGKVTPQVVAHLEGWGRRSGRVGSYARWYNRTLASNDCREGYTDQSILAEVF
jgi:hypothetical protein